MNNELIIEKINTAFPEIKWKEYRIENSGWNSYAVILDESFVFLLPKRDEDKNVFCETVELLDFLHSKIDIKIPEICLKSKDLKIIGYPYLSGPILSSELIQEMSLSERKILEKQVAKFLYSLHSIIPNKKLESICKTRSQINENVILENGVNNKLKNYLSSYEIRKIKVYLNELKNININSNVLLHGDFGIWHIIWNDNELSVIDFGEWGYGDPAYDFCSLFDHPEFAKNILDEYLIYSGTDNIYERILFYKKRNFIFDMIDSIDGFPVNFDEAYYEFQRNF